MSFKSQQLTINQQTSKLMQEPSLDPDKLSYEIFSILESKFLFDYDDDQKLCLTKDNAVQSINHHPRGKVCILSIDGGGGIRNIVSTKILSHLETLLKKKSENHDAKISDYFDVGTGSGFGGIFTAMLFASDDKNRPIFNADDTCKFLTIEGPKIYQRASFLNRVFGKTPSNRLMKAMKELFKNRTNGKFLTLRNTVKPVLIPCYDLSSKAPFLFSRADALQTDSYDFNLWEVCMATSAEPGVFEPVCMDSVDGFTRCMAVDGRVAMSNPTAAAITHVLHNKQEFPHVRSVEDILVLSVGTGGLELEGGFEYDKVKEWTAKEWAKPLGRISSDGFSEQVDQAVAMAYGQCRNGTGNYVRIQANGSNFARCGVNVDSDPSPSNVKMLSRIADETLKQKNVESVLFTGKRLGDLTNSEKLDWFADQLVLEHQRRSSRIAPTVAFNQATSQNPS